MVTTSPDNLWSPDGTQGYNLATDLAAMQTSTQAALSNFRKSRGYLTLTNAQRLALSGSDLFEGLTVWTTDTKQEWRYSNGTWGGTSNDSHAGNPGSNIAGVAIPGGSIALPQGVIIKTGMVTATATPQFGNEYMPRVTFTQPFPNSTLSVQFSQIGADGAAPHSNIATDDVSKTGFRVLYVGTSTTSKRSFMWVAFGY